MTEILKKATFGFCVHLQVWLAPTACNAYPSLLGCKAEAAASYFHATSAGTQTNLLQEYSLPLQFIIPMVVEQGWEWRSMFSRGRAHPLSKLAQWIIELQWNLLPQEEADTAAKRTQKPKQKRIKRLAKARWSRMHGKNKKKKGIQLPSKQAKKERKKESKKEAWELLLWMVWHTAFFLVFFSLPGDTTTYIHT